MTQIDVDLEAYSRIVFHEVKGTQLKMLISLPKLVITKTSPIGGYPNTEFD